MKHTKRLAQLEKQSGAIEITEQTKVLFFQIVVNQAGEELYAVLDEESALPLMCFGYDTWLFKYVKIRGYDLPAFVWDADKATRRFERFEIATYPGTPAHEAKLQEYADWLRPNLETCECYLPGEFTPGQFARLHREKNQNDDAS